MIERYTSTEADPGDRGHRFGSDHRDAVGRTVDAYERLFAEIHGLAKADLDRIGRDLRSWLQDRAPDLAVEIEAIAEGAGVPAVRLMAVNARTEILAGAARPECSVIGVGAACGPDGPLLAQNWDWHPDVADGLVIWTVIEPDGTWFTTLTEAGILAKVGLNSRGLALCLNILASSADGGVSGMPIHLLLRQVLQCCGDMESAEWLIGGHSFSASSALSVAAPAAGGDVAIRTFEVSPRGVQTLADRDGILLHTNHFHALPAGLEDRNRRDWPDTVARLEELEGTLPRPLWEGGGAGDQAGPELARGRADRDLLPRRRQPRLRSSSAVARLDPHAPRARTHGSRRRIPHARLPTGTSRSRNSPPDLASRVVPRNRRCYHRQSAAGWSSQVARRAHNPEVTGSNPVPAIGGSPLVERASCVLWPEAEPERASIGHQFQPENGLLGVEGLEGLDPAADEPPGGNEVRRGGRCS